jgi:deoxyguanosine kinase
MTQPALKRSRYIVIEGAIGVGKTTLARMLSEHLRSGLLLEVFEENPFLAKFYESRALYAFQTQMFFLLSRYRQQQRVPHVLAQGSMISDYMFDKDRLFAELNLQGDEWEVYQQIHTALAGQIAAPDLVVYLQADTDVLMGRIAQRDRPYERTMDRDYIEAVRQSYERFFTNRTDVPALFIDTNLLNFVTNPADLLLIVDRIRNVLQEGMFQPPLPLMGPPDRAESLLERGRPLADFQRFHGELDKVRGFNTDLYLSYLGLNEEMGALSHALSELWRAETASRAEGCSEEMAQVAMTNVRHQLEEELAECMAYLLKMANYAGIDLEMAYVEQMKISQNV